MLTTQIVEEYIQGQPLMTRQIFSILISSKNHITKQFLDRYMDALKEKLQELEINTGTKLLSYWDNSWFSLIAEKLTLEELITAFQADSKERKQKSKIKQLKFRLADQFSLVWLRMIIAASNSNLNKVTLEKEEQILDAICLASIHNKLLPIEINVFSPKKLKVEDMSLSDGEEISRVIFQIIFQSLVNEEDNIVTKVFESLENVKAIVQAANYSSFEAVLLTTIQICINEATVFGLQCNPKNFGGAEPYSRLDVVNDLTSESIYFWEVVNKTNNLINEQPEIEQFIRDCPTAKQALHGIIVKCNTRFIPLAVNKKLEVSKKLSEYLQKKYSQEQIVANLDKIYQIDLSNIEKKLTVIWQKVLRLSSEEWQNLERQSDFLTLTNNLCKKISLSKLIDDSILSEQNTSIKEVVYSNLVSFVNSKFGICSNQITDYRTLAEQAAFIDFCLSGKVI